MFHGYPRRVTYDLRKVHGAPCIAHNTGVQHGCTNASTNGITERTGKGGAHWVNSYGWKPRHMSLPSSMYRAPTRAHVISAAAACALVLYDPRELGLENKRITAADNAAESRKGTNTPRSRFRRSSSAYGYGVEITAAPVLSEWLNQCGSEKESGSLCDR